MMMSRGVIYEEVSIYRKPDSLNIEASRSRNAGCRSLPRIRYEQRQFLPMAVEIRWNGCLADAALKGARGRERTAKENVCRRADQVRVAAGSP